MKWVSQSKDLEVTLPDQLCPGVWSPAEIRAEAWELCWEPIMRTLFMRRKGESLEYPIKCRSVVTQRFPGEMFTTVLLEYIGGETSSLRQLKQELAIYGPGLEGRVQAGGQGADSIRSPMVGKILRVHVERGQRVERGQELFVVEAMKMENKIFAKNAGRLIELHALAGQQVSIGQVLAVVQAE